MLACFFVLRRCHRGWQCLGGEHETRDTEQRLTFVCTYLQYVDIFASITLMQPPRYLSLYKRLFGGGAGFWATNASPGGQHAELRMDTLSG